MGFLTVTAVLVLVVGTVSPIRLGRGPEATEARAGETVELDCDVNQRDGEPILWYHSTSRSYVTYNRDDSDTLDDDRRQRYSVQGSEYWYVFNLRIENLKPVDDGFFYCGYLNRGQFTVLGSARLTVIYPPDESSPVCSFSILNQPDSTNATVGSSVDLTCMWTGGNPSPTAVWYKQDASLDTHKEDSYVWTRMELTAGDNGLEFNCEIESSAMDHKRSCSVMPLRILPRVTITPPTAFVRIGDTVEFVCEGTGLPRIASYSWEGPTSLSSRRYELRAGNRVFRLIAVEAGDDGLEITCRVRTLRGLVGTESAVLRVILPTTPSPTTALETTTQAVPSTTLKPTAGQQTGKVTTRVIDFGPVSPKSPRTTQAPLLADDSQSSAALPKTTIIGIGAAAVVALVLIIAVLIVYMKRSRKSPIRRDTSIHLVNSTYETVIEGGRVLDYDQELAPPPGFQNYDRPRPVAAVSPIPQGRQSESGVQPPVRYAKVNKNKTREHDPLYDQVPDEPGVSLGLEGPTPLQEPTYMNQGALETRQEPDPREFNVEGLTYAELELDKEGRLHSKKNHTLYAKLK